jgi:hypothetical protein
VIVGLLRIQPSTKSSRNCRSSSNSVQFSTRARAASQCRIGDWGYRGRWTRASSKQHVGQYQDPERNPTIALPRQIARPRQSRDFGTQEVIEAARQQSSNIIGPLSFRPTASSADKFIDRDGPVGQRAVFVARTFHHEALSAPSFRMFTCAVAIWCGARRDGPVVIRSAVQASRTGRHKNN